MGQPEWLMGLDGSGRDLASQPSIYTPSRCSRRQLPGGTEWKAEPVPVAEGIHNTGPAAHGDPSNSPNGSGQVAHGQAAMHLKHRDDSAESSSQATTDPPPWPRRASRASIPPSQLTRWKRRGCTIACISTLPVCQQSVAERSQCVAGRGVVTSSIRSGTGIERGRRRSSGRNGQA